MKDNDYISPSYGIIHNKESARQLTRFMDNERARYKLPDNSLMEDDGTWDKNGNIKVEKVPVNRNPKWEQIDYNRVYEVVGKISQFEYKMCENQCKDTDTAIKAILNSRNANPDEYYWILKEDYAIDKARTHYLRTHLNDIEDDNEEKYY